MIMMNVAMSLLWIVVGLIAKGMAGSGVVTRGDLIFALCILISQLWVTRTN